MPDPKQENKSKVAEQCMVETHNAPGANNLGSNQSGEMDKTRYARALDAKAEQYIDADHSSDKTLTQSTDHAHVGLRNIHLHEGWNPTFDLNASKIERLIGKNHYTLSHNEGTTLKHEAESKAATEATLQAIDRVFADGKMTVLEARELNALKDVIFKAVDDNKITGAEEKEIVAMAAKIAPAEGFSKPSGGKGKS